MPDGDQLPVAGVDVRKLPAPGFLGFTGLGHDTLPRRLEIVFAGVQVAGVFIFPALEGQGVPGELQQAQPGQRPGHETRTRPARSRPA